MNFAKIKESYQKESKSVDKNIKYKYDPRPEFEGDSKIWQLLLEKAEQIDGQLYGNLHGFRCIGSRLKVENGSLKLMSKTNFFETTAEWKEYRKEFLLPFSEEIKNLFREITKIIKAGGA